MNFGLFLLFIPAILRDAAEIGFSVGLTIGAVISAVTLLLTLRGSAMIQLAVLGIGAGAATMLPLYVEDWRASRDMRSRLEEAELRAVSTYSFFASLRLRDQDSGGRAHGIACDQDGWPYLWSYRARDWVAVPERTGWYRASTPERAAATCAIK
ncbi:MAG: hypothetical protein AAGK37_20745 [Pseudomonadota bacterium]